MGLLERSAVKKKKALKVSWTPAEAVRLAKSNATTPILSSQK
jgi:hypothetical protein